MKRWLALAWILCCLTGCARAEKGNWTQEEWQDVVEALASDAAEPVRENRRVSYRSSWLPAISIITFAGNFLNVFGGVPVGP